MNLFGFISLFEIAKFFRLEPIHTFPDSMTHYYYHCYHYSACSVGVMSCTALGFLEHATNIALIRNLDVIYA